MTLTRIAGVIFCLGVSSAWATTLTFDEIPFGDASGQYLGEANQILNYYNGGTASGGQTGGATYNYGVSFDAFAVTSNESADGGTQCQGTLCDFIENTASQNNYPTPNWAANGVEGTIMSFHYNNDTGGCGQEQCNGVALSSVVNFNNGLNNFSIYYANPTAEAGTITFYNGLGGNTGGNSALGSISLPGTPTMGDGGPCDNNNPNFVDFCQFNLVSTDFGYGNTAYSAVFNIGSNGFDFDNLSFGQDAPPSGAPEPSTLLMLGIGVVSIAAARRKRSA